MESVGDTRAGTSRRVNEEAGARERVNERAAA